ncbi:LysR family transcriptional regulator [Parvularcula sp. ZS-1/3]|uniref:LysR family transcriptional regulator n=1 Tax=Parvularcula mediterranea TaxID=2732508 RepID=A0A7Y3W504_9PROT|nr:hydrogen peroxide-inducible genes activator [Parvularcula mediterranea]NNU15787.1 LysR family transcriptional regulator [Parvularcula mediterranea]
MQGRSQDITLRQLRYLVALKGGGGFRKGADLAGISQPSFSAQIKLLEQTLGVRVAERGNGSFAMTPIGRELVANAVDILDRVDGLVKMSESGPLTGVLRLGVKATLGPYLMPGVVRQLHKTHPSLRLFVREGPPVDLERELTDGLHDVVLAQLPLGSADVQSIRLFREGLFLAVATDHPLAGRETFEPSDLSGLDVLSLSPRYHLHDQVLRLCEENGARLRRDYEGTSLDALRQMVGMGLGVTFLPALYVNSEVRGAGDVAVLKPKRSQLARSVGLAWRRGSSLTEAYEAIAESVRSVVGGGTWGVTPEA